MTYIIKWIGFKLQNKLAPVVLFVYNRPEHTKKTLSALQNNILALDSELFIYSDAAKSDTAVEKVNKVRQLLTNISGFKKVTIIKQEKNKGLANSIISGVTEVVNKYGKIIVLEDDLVTSPYFLSYMNKNLVAYENEKQVASIHGYIYPIENLAETFFIKGADCWGWATWQDRWSVFESNGQILLDEIQNRNLKREADFNDSYGYTQMLKDQIAAKNNSWAIRWYFSSFLKGMLTLYPGQSYVQNIGHDAQGTHCLTETNVFDVILNQQFSLKKISVKECISSKNKIEEFFKKQHPTLFKKLLSKFKRLIY